MKKKRALAASRIPDDYVIESNHTGYVIRDPSQEPNSIVLNVGPNEEMVKISKDGFWVRGVKVAQDDREAEIVYNAFKEWMVWSAISRSY